ncbi:hypothetical protein [Methylobacterium nigriterrae]|uniref:hypothetical protein n=1 Tax=Methylobacterium nigriterrae TaxID=3127512 RepID=UPI0030136606
MLTELLKGGWLQGLPYRLGLLALAESTSEPSQDADPIRRAAADGKQHPTTRDFILMAQAARRAASYR